jgi:LysR family transcriptional regulator, glycine cleavage system transcriptional activator
MRPAWCGAANHLANQFFACIKIEFLCMRDLSRLKAVHALEASARLGSFALAAKELHVTPAAVGQQVRLLEAWLGSALFHRINSGSQRLKPTEATAQALAELSAALDQIDASLRHLRERAARQVLTVTASQAFVARWLLHRLDGFTVAHPEVDVRLDVSDRTLDLNLGDADVAVRCGAGPWPGHSAQRLMGESMVVVASPALLASRNPGPAPADLLGLPLLHDGAMARWPVFPSWAQWFEAQGVAMPATSQRIQIDATGAVIQAALNSQGLALTRSVLVEDAIASGALVHLCPQSTWPSPWAYHLLLPKRRSPKPQAKQFEAWLLAAIM